MDTYLAGSLRHYKLRLRETDALLRHVQVEGIYNNGTSGKHNSLYRYGIRMNCATGIETSDQNGMNAADDVLQASASWVIQWPSIYARRWARIKLC